MIRFCTILLAAVFCGENVIAQTTIKKELDVGFASLDAVKPILQQALTPQGKFVLLPAKGSVMVIDTPEGILAAEAALGNAELPNPTVALDFKFVTGLPSRSRKITVAQEVPFPIEYEAPQIIVNPGGNYTVIPATPTRFVTRNIGVTSETASTLNPDGSVTLDIDTESTTFDGFVNYGSAILPAGQIGNVPVIDQVGDPAFFSPFARSGDILLPIISTTRISTSVVIRPRVNLGVVSLDVMPRLTVETDETEESVGGLHTIDLSEFSTQVDVQNEGVGRVYGFPKADDEFNRRFFGAEDADSGRAAIVVKAKIRPPEE